MVISASNDFFLNRLFTTYPETQKMFPRIADVPVSELMSNRKFLSISYSAFAGFNFILNNMDDPEIIKLQLSKVDYPGTLVFPFPGTTQLHQVRTHTIMPIKKNRETPLFQVQILPQNTSRIVLEVFREELGTAFTAEAASGWTSLLNFITQALIKNVAVSPLSAADFTILKDNLKMINKDSNIGAKAVHKEMYHQIINWLINSIDRIQIAYIQSVLKFDMLIILETIGVHCRLTKSSTRSRHT